MKGSEYANPSGTYGTPGVAGPGNTPGGRYRVSTWVGGSGELWLFGGYGVDAAGNSGNLNDLWQYNPSTHAWTWCKGSSLRDAAGVHGTRGVGAPGNTPGARGGATTWVGADGALWLYGGYGKDAAGNNGTLSDLWRHDVGTGNWIWVKGSALRHEASVHGTQGVGAAGNTPGARSDGSAWVDAAGKLWLFGGYGNNGPSVEGPFSDLWCYDPAGDVWTWMKGPSIVKQAGVYGTQGVEAAGNNPGARDDAQAWRDAEGKLWLHGGYGYTASGDSGYLSDLWCHDPASGNWTWVRGLDEEGAVGVYGTRGMPSAEAIPGARDSALAWTGADGTFWLFGGYGYGGSAMSTVRLADLWRYSPTTGEWAWEAGPKSRLQAGVYGPPGEAAAKAVPGGREEMSAWPDAAGGLWLFGGYGLDDNGATGRLNDLWRYDVAAGAWAWMKGSAQVDPVGIYGTQGAEATANTPGGRQGAMSWADADGGLWLLGGLGYGRSTSWGRLNDLWRFDPATGNWTWRKGADTTGAVGVYGTQGIAAEGNAPGAREDGAAWRGADGALWLFGGYGLGATASTGALGDLWRFDPATGHWAWMKGSQYANASASYGTQGVSAATNTPGGRDQALAWTDGDGNLWLFGGWGRDRQGIEGRLNDLWKHDPGTGEWTWVKGADLRNQVGAYGSMGVAAEGNVPGARQGATGWADGQGRLWLHGGYGYGETTTLGRLNDLWLFDPATGNWTWLGGSALIDRRGTYGTQGTGSANHAPGGRTNAVSVVSGQGHWWLFGGDAIDREGRSGRMNDLWRMAFFHDVRYLAGERGTIVGEAVQRVPHGGSTSEVTANADGGCHFVAWSDGSLANPRQDAAVTQDMAVTATFALNEYAVTLRTDGTPGATLNGAAAVTATVIHGQPFGPVTASAPAGFGFAGWRGDVVGQDNPLLLASVTGEVVATATFGRIRTLAVAVVGVGATLPSAGEHTVVEGLPLALTALPSAGHHLVSWAAGGQAQLAEPQAVQTTVTVTGDAAVTATFAINRYTVRFGTDGTEGAFLTGELVQTVDHGGSCTPVLAISPEGLAFLGWDGDAAGMDNPLTVTGVAADQEILARFGLPLACGKVFGIDAEDMPWLPNAGFFMVRPKVYAIYQDPVSLARGRTASAKVLTKVAKPAGAARIEAEWSKRICLFSRVRFKADQAQGVEAGAWLAVPGRQDILPLAMRLRSVEVLDRPSGFAMLMPPEIAGLEMIGPDAKGRERLAVTGWWFGTKKPKVWLEYRTAKGIKGQALKVLAADDPDHVDAGGKPACMDAATGASRLVVILPAQPPKGEPTGDLVLDNGVGLAVAEWPTP